MKLFLKFFATFFSLIHLLCFALQAQQNHFIYMQTENKQPFYVKTKNRLLSSSATGYLIIPKLTEGDYQLTIGFPKNEWPEQEVACSISNKDLGFLLKNFDEKGWGLFNLQSMNLIMAFNKNAVEKDISTKEEIASFQKETLKTRGEIVSSNITKSDIVTTEKPIPQKPIEAGKQQNKSILISDVKVSEVIYPKIEPKVDSLIKQDDSKVVTNVVVLDTDNLIENNSANSKNESKTTPMVTGVTVKNIEEKLPSINRIKEDKQTEKPLIKTSENFLPAVYRIKKLFSISSNQGIDLVYEDEINSNADTIRIFIPFPIGSFKIENKTEILDLTNSNKVKENIKTGDVKFIEIEVSNPNTQEQTLKSKINPTDSFKSQKVTVKQNQVIDNSILSNSDCKIIATEDDFFKLRKKMAGEANNVVMIEIAKNTFKSMCFTTVQLKNLSVLFLNDEGKYRFFDEAYPFVSDSNNYSTLQTVLHDPYYINRFKAMLRR